MHTTEHLAVIIVNDQPLMTQALVSLLNAVLDRPVVLLANSLLEGISLCRGKSVSLAILQIDLPAYGLHMLKQFRCAAPDAALLTMSSEEASVIVERVLALGVKGHLSVRDTQTVFSVAISRVLRGERYISPRFSFIQGDYMNSLASPAVSARLVETAIDRSSFTYCQSTSCLPQCE